MFPARTPLMAIVVLGILLAASAPLVAAESKGSGTVTMAGKPLATGKITFHRDNGQFVGSKIKDGKYSIDNLPVGTMKVAIEGQGVPLKFGSEETTGLSVQAKEDRSVFDFNIE